MYVSPGGGTEDLTSPSINTLEGIFRSAPGRSTTDVGQARLALAHQLIAAEANAHLVGTFPKDLGFSATLLTDAIAALDKTDINLMNALASQLDAFNNRGDNNALPLGLSPGAANSKGAAGLAVNPGAAFN